MKNDYTNLPEKVKNLGALPLSKTFLVTQEYIANLPGISVKFYGTVDFWRVLMHFNGLRDPLNDVLPGALLSIPNLDAVREALKAQTPQKVGLNTP